MTDFDPDAYLQGAKESTPTFDPDAYLSTPSRATASSAPLSEPGYFERGAERLKKIGEVTAKHPFTTLPGLGEIALSGITGGIGSVADVVTGATPGTHNWAYQPRTEAGRELGAVGAAEEHEISKRYDEAFGTGPAATEIKSRIPEAIGAISTVVPAIKGAGGIAGFRESPLSAQDILDRSDQASPQSMGAASAAPRLTNVSPELEQAVRTTARASGGAVNREALNRHIEADSLPIKIQLTPGQATQDPALISHEMNNRARIPGLPDLLDQQNKKLAQNLQAIRDDVGPDVFTTNSVEHGDTLIKAYQDKGAAADANTAAKYQALRDANGGKFPVDAKQLFSNVEDRLHDQLLYEHAPTQLGQLKALAEKGNMTFEQFEAMRTNLARTMRSSTDGNERAAAGVIRQEMEKLPLSNEAGNLKGIADQARAAAKSQFDALDADPAYKAAVNGTVPPDRFVQKYIINAPRDDVEAMRANLAHDPVATQTMGVAALDHLRRVSDPNGTGNFGQASFNRHLQALDPKLGSVVSPRTAEQLETLGNVARYTQAQPKGSFVNNSNTLVGALAEHAANAAEGMANVAAKGFPVGTITRKVLQNRSNAKLAKETMTPYGGMKRLPESKP